MKRPNKKRNRRPLARGALWTVKGNVRPNKLARGAQETSDRSSHEARLTDSALSLVVHGTCDKLARGINWSVRVDRQRKCPCCQQVIASLVLSDYGRGRLAELRRRRVARLAINAEGASK